MNREKERRPKERAPSPQVRLNTFDENGDEICRTIRCKSWWPISKKILLEPGSEAQKKETSVNVKKHMLK